MGNRKSMLPTRKINSCCLKRLNAVIPPANNLSSNSGQLEVELPNIDEQQQRKQHRPMKRIRSRFLSDDEPSMSSDTVILQNKQKDLEAENRSLKELVEKLTQENQRSETERNRTFVAFQKQEEDMNHWKMLHESGVEQLNSVKNEMDKLYLSFKNYRESKESEIQQLLKQKLRLESRLSRLGCYIYDETNIERNSITEESVPPSPGFSSRADWFGSNEWDAVSGSQTLLSTVDIMLRDELAALEEASILRSSAVVALYVITDANYENLRSSFFATFSTPLHKLVINSGRLFKPVFTNSNFNTLDEIRESGEATIFVSFAERSLSIQLRQKIRKIFLENDRAVLGVFCYPKNDGDRRVLSKLPVWDKVCVDSRSRLINDETNRNQQMQLVFSEIEKFLKNDLNCRDVFEADEPQGYDEFLTCEDILSSNAFDMYSRCFDDVIFEDILRKSEGHYLERQYHNEQLMSHVLSPGPMSPMLVSGNAGVGVSTLFVHWINRLRSVFADSLFVLYHFVTDRRSLAADPVAMLRRFNKILQANLSTPNFASSSSSTTTSTMFPTNVHANTNMNSYSNMSSSSVAKLSQDPEKIRQKFLQLLEKVSSRYTHGVVVIIDRIDLLYSSEISNPCLNWLVDPLPVDCRVVVSVHSNNCKSEWRSWPSLIVEEFTNKEIPTWLNGLTKRSDISVGEARQLATTLNTKLASVCDLRAARPLTLMSRAVSTYGRSLVTKIADVKRTEDLCTLILHKIVDSITAPIEQDILKKILLSLRYSRDGLSLYELFDLVPKLSIEKWCSWFVSLNSFDCIRCVCGLYKLTCPEVVSAVTSVCQNKKSDQVSESLYAYWKRNLLENNLSWRTIDQLVYYYYNVNLAKSRDEFRKFLLRPDVFVNFVKRGLSWKLLEMWHLCFNVDKTSLASVYSESLHDDWPVCLRGEAYLGLSVISHELELGTLASTNILQNAMEIYLTGANSDHPVIALILHEMAHCYMQSGRISEAELLLKRSQQTFSSLFGPYHRTVEVEMETLAQVYRFQNKTKLADQLERQIVHLRNKRQQSDARLHVSRRLQTLHRRSVGDSSSTTVNTLETVKVLTELGMLHYYRGSLDVAEDVLRQAVETKETLVGAESHDLCRELANLACVLSRKKLWDKAEIVYKRLLNIKSKSLTRDEAYVREIQQQLVNVFLKLNKINDAEPVLCELAEYFRTSVVRQPKKLVLTLCHLAVVYCEQGLHDRAEPILDEASDICRQQLPADQKLNNKVQKIYAKLYFEVGNIEQAARIFMQSSCSSSSQNASRKSSQQSVHNNIAVPASQFVVVPANQQQPPFVLAPAPPGRLRRASSGFQQPT